MGLPCVIILLFFGCLLKPYTNPSSFLQEINSSHVDTAIKKDTILFNKRLLFADKKISNEFILSCNETPTFILKNLDHILHNNYHSSSIDGNSYFYFTNKYSSEICEIIDKDKIEKYYNPRSWGIRIYYLKKTKRVPIRTNYKSFITDGKVQLGMTVADFSKIKDISIYEKHQLDKNKIIYSYDLLTLNLEERERLYGRKYICEYPFYHCYYIFDLRTSKLLEYGIGIRY